MVVRRVPWPHEGLYTAPEKPAVYQDNMAIALFVQGHMVTLNGEEGVINERMATHLEDLMSDAKLYGWEWTRAFHGVWSISSSKGQPHGMTRRRN